MKEWWDDWWRVFKRNRRKQLGLPATEDVGNLSGPIIQLRQRAEAALSIKITEAAMSAPHLAAIYQDDIQDILTYARLEHVTIRSNSHPVLWETAAAYAGHGLGLCKDFCDAVKCRQELADYPHRTILSVHYAPNALTLSLAVVWAAPSLWEPSYRRRDNFYLGSEEARGGPWDGDFWQEYYWERLRDEISDFFAHDVDAYLPAQIVMFLGESAPVDKDEPFARLVMKSLEEYQALPSEVYYKNATTVTAKGTAELVKRNWYTELKEIFDSRREFEILPL